jgi:hypothetical protein
MSLTHDVWIVAAATLGFGIMFSGFVFAKNARADAGVNRLQLANLFEWVGMSGGFIAAREIVNALYLGTGLSVGLWIFPAAWFFTSVSGLVLSRYHTDGGSSTAGSFLSNAMKRVYQLVRRVAGGSVTMASRGAAGISSGRHVEHAEFTGA